MDYDGIKADDSGFVDIGGAKIYYRRNRAKNPSGKAPLLAVHGGPGITHDYLLPLLELADDMDVIFYDQIDTGRSERPNDKSRWTLEHFTSEIDCIRDALGLDELNIFASSWGSSIAANYASQAPQGLRSVSFSGALISTARWVADNAKYRRQLPVEAQEVLDRCEAAEDYDNPEYLAATDLFYHRHLCRLDEWPAYVMRSFEMGNVEQYRYMWGPTEFHCVGTLKELDLTPGLARITAPVLFMSGEFDEGTPATSADFVALARNAELYVVKDASHMPHVEKTAEVIARLKQFLL